MLGDPHDFSNYESEEILFIIASICDKFLAIRESDFEKAVIKYIFIIDLHTEPHGGRNIEQKLSNDASEEIIRQVQEKLGEEIELKFTATVILL